MKYRKDGKPDGRSLSARGQHICNWRCFEIRRVLAVYPPVSLQGIGDRFGLTRERVRQIIRDHGWRKRPAPMPQKAGGTLCKTCGQRYVLTAYNGQDILSQQRAHNAIHNSKWRHRHDKRALVVAMYLADWRVQEIADYVGWKNAETVYTYLRTSGVKANRGVYARVWHNGRIMRKQDAEQLQAQSVE